MFVSQCLLLLTLSLSELCDGDLLFVAPAQDNAITAVTTGVEALPIDHVAVYHPMGDTPMVIEAIPSLGVTVTPLELVAQRGTVIVGRVNNVDVEASLDHVLRLVGRAYDTYFDNDDEYIYCSELVQHCYVTAAGKALFEPIPMTFRDNSGAIPQFWRDHYGNIGREVPEGEPGSNPGELSRRPAVTILGTLSFTDISTRQ